MIEVFLQQQRAKWVQAQMTRFGVTQKQAHTYFLVHDPLNHGIIRAIMSQFPETKEYLASQLLESG